MKNYRSIIYWVATLWLSLGMVSSAVVQFIRMPEVLQSFKHLEYPLYLLPLLAVWKILGIVVLLAPKLPLVKEWAYAGFVFVTTGALYSHLAKGDGIGDVFPSILLLALTIVSWIFRPESRRLV